jgi:hypothetical protein
MLALGLAAAKNLAIIIAIVFVVLMVLSAWVVKKVTTKLIMVVVMAGLALLVWSQRASLEDCAQRVRDRQALGDKSDVTCSFFGTDVNVPAAP